MLCADSSDLQEAARTVKEEGADSTDLQEAARTMKEEEEKLKKKYGGMLPNKKDVLKKRLKGSDKKYFDSADWAKDLISEGAKEEAAPAPSDALPPSGEVSLDQTTLDQTTFPPEPHQASMQSS